jgi:hypothetical protein
MGLVIIVDLVSRSRHLVAHYTELGVAPREVLAGQYGLACSFSLHYWLSGSPVAVALLFVVSGVAAIALVAGWRTRIVTVVCWYLLASLLIRNPLVTFAGDRTLQVLLFWAMFLPLGARWSLDARRKPAGSVASNTYVSVGTFALLMQVCLIYWFSAVFKQLSPIWPSGEAVAVALSVEALVKPLGLWIAQFGAVLPLMTHATLNFEIVGPFIPFVPGFTTPGRMAAVVAFLLLHLTFGLCFSLGMFPFMSAVAWLVFIPSWFWVRLERRFGGALPEATGVELSPSRLSNVIAGLCFALVLALNVHSVPAMQHMVPSVLDRLGRAMRLEQSWGMFTTDKIPHGWFVVPGRLANGEEVDLLGGGGPVPWTQPELVTAIYPSSRWIQLLHGYPQLADSPYWPSFAAYFCDAWNSRHDGDQRVERLSIGYVYRDLARPGPAGLHPEVFIEYECE